MPVERGACVNEARSTPYLGQGDRADRHSGSGFAPTLRIEIASRNQEVLKKNGANLTREMWNLSVRKDANEASLHCSDDRCRACGFRQWHCCGANIARGCRSAGRIWRIVVW